MVYVRAIGISLCVTDAWQLNPGLRVRVLRAIRPEIGESLVVRAGTRWSFWRKRHTGARSWKRGGVSFHDQDHVRIGRDDGQMLVSPVSQRDHRAGNHSRATLDVCQKLACLLPASVRSVRRHYSGSPGSRESVVDVRALRSAATECRGPT